MKWLLATRFGNMNRRSFINGRFAFVTSVGCLFLAAGCGDSQIKTYRIAKEDHARKPEVHSADDGHDHGAPAPSRPTPNLRWNLPKGWHEQPSDGMRKAVFQINGSDGKMAQVMVIPLPGASNIEMESVNMWREELGLPVLTREQVAAQAEPVDFGDAKGHLFEMSMATPKSGQKFKMRTLGAMAERGNVLWFVKMTGEDELVAQEKPAFVGFLKSLGFEEGGTRVASAERPASTNEKEVPAGSDAPKWKVPENWQEKAPGPMVTAAYTVTGEGGPAEIAISKFPGDVGGMVANVNRWRGQLGLAPMGDAEARGSVQMVEIDGKRDAYMVDLKGTNARTGKPARMVALGVPRAGETWFYKLTGDEKLVEKEKDAFLKFVITAY